MRKIFYFYVFCNFAIIVNAQITMVSENDIAKPQLVQMNSKDTISIIPYDSLQPIFIKMNDTIQYKKYFGQKLFLPSKSGNGVYYTIIDIKISKFAPILKLKEDVSSEVIEYELNRTGGYYPEYGYITDEFVTVGYFVKLKQLYENKNMIWFLGDKDYDNREYPKTVEDDENTIMDRITSRIYTKKDAGVNFKCIGIKLSADNEIVAILKSEKDTIAVKCPKDLNDREYIIRYLCGIDYYNNGFTSYITPKLKHACLEKFILEDDVKMLENDKKYLMFKNGQLVRKELDYENERLKECVKLYGEKKGKLIANYTITLGMTKAMCESAGFKLQSTVITKEGKVQIYNSRSETAVLVNGIVTKIHK